METTLSWCSFPHDSAIEIEVHSVTGSGAKVGEWCWTDHLLSELSETWEKILKKVKAYTCCEVNYSVQKAQLEKAYKLTCGDNQWTGSIEKGMRKTSKRK